jgi:hypothetical protein
MRLLRPRLQTADPNAAHVLELVQEGWSHVPARRSQATPEGSLIVDIPDDLAWECEQLAGERTWSGIITDALMTYCLAEAQRQAEHEQAWLEHDTITAA